MACGRCWEAAIRADERVVVDHGLPPACPPDPSHVDEIAIERALAGAPVRLTPRERAVVAHRQRAAMRYGRSCVAGLVHSALRNHHDTADAGVAL